MDENAKGKRSGCGPVGCGTIVAVLLLATVLYVLSVAPAFNRTYGDGAMRLETFETLYAPLIWLTKHGWKPVDDCLTGYMFLWLPPNHGVPAANTPPA